MNNNCNWPGSDELMQTYHNEEWGKPVHNDQKLFEFIILDTFQAGLSWKTILHKRENFRKAFDNFDIAKISTYEEVKIQELMQDASIVRNQAKIRATVTNAQSFQRIQAEYGTFDAYIWKFTQGKTIINYPITDTDIPSTSKESDSMSQDLRSRGFKFVGSTICYAFMQAAGIVNDHLQGCQFK